MGIWKARIYYLIRRIVQPIQDFCNDKRLRNKDFSIICGTCAGGIIYHRCRRQFQSPTVNLWFTEKDLQTMAKDLKHYMNCELRFLGRDSMGFPVADLGGVMIHFNHAKNEEEARELWNRRKVRVNYENVWLLSSDRGLSYEDIKAFGELPAKGRVMFTAKEYPEFDYCLCIKEYEGKRENVGVYMSDHTPVMDHFVWEKYFDYVGWLNTGKIRNKL